MIIKDNSNNNNNNSYNDNERNFKEKNQWNEA